jgi:glyoxylase-like metal-dependent hydrolase (beta-lactamase superfamily II)
MPSAPHRFIGGSAQARGSNTTAPLSRRALLRSVAASAAGMVLPRFSQLGFAAGNVVATPVAPDLTLLEGAGGNVLVLATEAGKVLVDSGAAAFTSDLLATVEALPGGAVTALFNTHWHLDQIGGNEALGRAGATIFAHEKTRLRLRNGYYLPTEDRYEKPLPEAALPTESFHTTHATSIGGRRIECGYLLEAHTDGDIYVAFPDLNVIAVGDVLAPARDPVFDWFGGGWLGGRVDSLALLLALSDAGTRFVPSYGPVVGRADVQAEHAMLLELFDRMVVHVRLGESSEDMLAAGVLEGLGRTFDDPAGLLYSLHKGFWAHHNKLTHDIV